MSRPHVVLVGMMGAGKTTVGVRLAQRLDRPFLDSDELVEAQTGRTVAEIFAADGEATFRAVETSVLLEMLDREVPAVIAAAGGAVLDAANRTAIRDRATVVWLRVDPAVLASRVGAGGHRPLLADDPGATLSRLATEREPLYRDAAAEIVDVGDLTPDQVVDRVIVEIGAVA